MNLEEEAQKYGATYTPPTQDDYHSLGAQYGATYSPPSEEPQSMFSPRGQAIGQDLTSAGSNIKQAITGQGQYQGQSAIRRGTEATATAFNTPLKVASEFLPSGVKNVLGKVGQGFGGIVNWLGDKLGSTKVAQDFVTKHPDAAKTLEEIAGTGQAAGDISQNILVAGGAKKVGEVAGPKVDSLAQSGLKSVENKLAERSATKQLDRAYQAATPSTKHLTPTEYQSFLEQKKITPKTASEPSRYILSDNEKMTAQKYKDILQSKDPVKNSVNVMNEIANRDKQVGDFLRKNNGTFNNGELSNYLSNKLKDVTDISIPEGRIANLKDTMINGFIKALPKNNMETLWQARKSFDKSIEKVFSGSPTLQNTIKKEFRNGIQDYIAERTPEGQYKGYMKDMRQLYNLHDTIATKAVKERGGNWLQVWAKNNPNKLKILGWTGGILGGAEGIKLLKK